MAANVGSLIATLALNTAKFVAGIKKAEGKLRRFQRNMKKRLSSIANGLSRATKAILAMGVALAAVVTGAMAAMILSSARLVDEQTKFAKVIGTTQEELVGIQLAARELSGVLDTQVNMALQRMTRRVAEAAKGTGEGQQAIKDLGLDAKQLAKQDPAQTFRDISDAIQGVPEESERLRIAFKLFDSEGARLVTTLSAGSEELEKYREKARKLGITMTEDQTKSIELMNDSMDRLKLVMTGIGNIMALVLSPIITGIANDFEDASIKADKFAQVEGFFNGLISTLGFVGDVTKRVVEGWAQLWLLATKIAQGPQFLDFLKSPALNQAYADQVASAQAFVDELDRTLDPSERAKIYVETLRKQFDELRANYVKGNQDFEATVRAGASITRDIYSDVGSAITQDFENWNEAILNVFKNTLLEMAAVATGNQLRNIFGNIFRSIAPTAVPASAFSTAFDPTIPKFANGGSFRVGGAGGTDSQRVSFMASPGETVSVKTQGQQAGSDAGITIINKNDFRGVDSVSRQQLERALKQNSAITMAQIQNKIARDRFA